MSTSTFTQFLSFVFSVALHPQRPQGLIVTGAQHVHLDFQHIHLDFHTAPELCEEVEGVLLGVEGVLLVYIITPGAPRDQRSSDIVGVKDFRHGQKALLEMGKDFTETEGPRSTKPSL